ncbi:MAG TPA: hypothetical protein VMF31_02680 [Solirubrobacterales bacterium]|nr:hypothetical protein [Solirubrobacterales bacterium]
MIRRTIPLDAQNALVLATAPLMMVVPYVLTFSPEVGLVSFFLGALLMAVALAGSTRSLSVSAHEGFNWVLGLSTLAIGIVAGILGNVPVAAIFLVGFGSAHLALTALTRYSARGA